MAIKTNLLCITHHTLIVEPWNNNGVRVLDQDTEMVRFLLRDKKEVSDLIIALNNALEKETINNAC